MAKASANFHFDGNFYAAGSILPKDVAEKVGKHLIAKAPAKAAEAQAKTEEVKTEEVKTQAKSEDLKAQEWADTVRAMDNEQLVEAAKEAGITGKNSKSKLVELLIENGEPA